MKEQGRVTLADRILSGMQSVALPVHDPKKDESLYEFCEFIRSSLADATIIEASNVAQYYFSHVQPKGDNLCDTIPNMAPPFDKFWIEFKSHSTIAGGSGKTGCMFWATKFSNAAEAEKYASEHSEWEGLMEWRENVNLDAPFWHLQCAVVVSTTDGFAPLMMHPYFVDSLGRPAVKDSPSYLLGAYDHFHIVDAHNSIHRATLMAGLLAISFMHCKNIVVKEETPPAALSKSFEKRNGRPLVRYHTLEIEPMKRVLESEGGASHNGLKKALHICRGHFATYTPDKPLFGRVVGTVWKSAHARGSASQGTVVKDYKVKIAA